jgi:phosphate starvation-inducible PhoH-like protein
MSGLRHVCKILRETEGVSFDFFTARDVVRHPLVQRIVAAYDSYENVLGNGASEESDS